MAALCQSVFAHASCLNDGGHCALAGVGLFFGPADSRNGVEVPLPFGNQIRQSASGSLWTSTNRKGLDPLFGDFNSG